MVYSILGVHYVPYLPLSIVANALTLLLDSLSRNSCILTVMQKEGKDVKPSSFRGLLLSLNRHLKEKHTYKRIKRIFDEDSSLRSKRFWPRENRASAKKKLEGGREERRRKRLRTNPSILKTPVRPRRGSLIGAARIF